MAIFMIIIANFLRYLKNSCVRQSIVYGGDLHVRDPLNYIIRMGLIKTQFKF